MHAVILCLVSLGRHEGATGISDKSQNMDGIMKRTFGLLVLVSIALNVVLVGNYLLLPRVAPVSDTAASTLSKKLVETQTGTHIGR